MTFDEAYQLFYPQILRYCYTLLSDNRYYAEEAASKAFFVLYQKWDSLESHEEIVIHTWLIRAARFTTKEAIRLMPPAYVGYEEQDCIDEIEASQNLVEENSVLEDLQYQAYIREIEARLRPSERLLFRLMVVESLPYERVAEQLQITVNAVRIQWMRLRLKLKPMIEEIVQIRKI